MTLICHDFIQTCLKTFINFFSMFHLILVTQHPEYLFYRTFTITFFMKVVMRNSDVTNKTVRNDFKCFLSFISNNCINYKLWKLYWFFCEIFFKKVPQYFQFFHGVQRKSDKICKGVTICDIFYTFSRIRETEFTS